MVWHKRMMAVGDMAARNWSRRTGRDVLPYKSACVWCTAINLNDLSPPRACFGIQEPQQGLLACQGCSSFGLPPLWNSLLIRTCGWGRDWLQHAHYLPLSLRHDSLLVPQSQHISPLELRQKAPSSSQAANCAPQLLGVHMCICSQLNTALPGLTAGCAVFLRKRCHPLLHMWCLSDQCRV